MTNHQSFPPRTSRSQPARAPKGVRQPRKPRRVLRFVFSLLLLVIIGLASYAGYLLVKTKDTLNGISNQKDNTVAAAERAQVKPIGLVLLGLDTRDETRSLNTDVIMTAVFNPKTKTATVVSIPRDSRIELSGYRKQKVNAFYAGFMRQGRAEQKLQGDELKAYALTETRQLMSDMFGIPLDYTAVIDFQGFTDVVDAIGGVHVYVDQSMKYRDTADGTNINLQKGDQQLNGEDALGFVRYRHSKNGETRASSDFERNDRQDRVLGAIVEKLKSFGSVTKVGGVLDAVRNNMRTDIEEKQIENMIKTYFGISKTNIRFIALTGDWKSPFVYLHQDKLEEAKRALEEELNPEGRTSSAPSASPTSSALGNG